MAKSREAFRTISEVAEWLDVQSHVLRFWESKFSQVKPVKRAGGRRYYRREDMELLGGLKKVLHEDGMSIKDAQKLLREKGVKHVAALSQPVDEDAAEDAVEAQTAEETLNTDQQISEAPVQEVVEDPADDAAAEPETDVETADQATEVEETTETTEAADLVEDVQEPEEATDLVADSRSQEEPEKDTVDAALDADALPPEGPEELKTEADEAPELPIAESASDAPQMDDLFAPRSAPSPAPAAPAESGVSAGPNLAEMQAASKAIQGGTSEVSPTAPVGGEPSMAADAADSAPLPEPGPVADIEDSVAADAPLDAPASETMDAAAPAQSTSLPGISETSEQPATTASLAPALGATAPPAPAEGSAQTPKSGVDTAGAVSTPAYRTKPDDASVTANEDSRDEFLLMFRKPVAVAPQSQSRAAELLARLEALHNKAG